MKSLKKFSKRLCKNERGQGMVEYILLLVIVVGIVFLFKGKIMEQVNTALGELSGKMGDVLGN
jgi:Flp pilus assembly pilin Flp